MASLSLSETEGPLVPRHAISSIPGTSNLLSSSTLPHLCFLQDYEVNPKFFLASNQLESVTMGAMQSKEPIAGEKLLIERLRALEAKDQSDNDYVHVDEKAVLGTSKKFRAPWTAVSVSDVEHWEHELLQDPKNRYVPLAVAATTYS
jgi:hypothetical protein